MEQPKVTVIVPVYGVERYIERCAESLFAQTLDGIEFIFIDDCTPDRSMERLNAVIEKHRPRFAGRNWQVRTERMLANGGQAAVREHGIRLATGRYIAHCDSDDWVEPEIYEKLYTTAANKNCDIVWCDFYCGDENSKTVMHTLPRSDMTKQEVFDAMFGSNEGQHSVCSSIVRREIMQGDISFPVHNMGEDYALMAQAVYYAKSVAYIREPLYNYFQNPASIMHPQTLEKRWNNAFQFGENVKLVIDFFREKGVGEKYIDCQKLSARFAYIGLRKEKGFRKVWRNIYPELNGHVVANRNFTRAQRIKYLIVELGLPQWVFEFSRKMSKL